MRGTMLAVAMAVSSFGWGISFEKTKLLVRSDVAPKHFAVMGVSHELRRIGIHTLHLSPFFDAERVRDDVAAMRGVVFAEVDEELPPSQGTWPNDPIYLQGLEWHLVKLGIVDAWGNSVRGWIKRSRSALGSRKVVVAVCDTGVNGAHEDLTDRMVGGWNVNDNSPDTSDVHGHGTMVAGCVAATTNNGLGIAGVSWYTSLMPVRVSTLNGTAYFSVIAQGILWAMDHGARVANVSYAANTSYSVMMAAQMFFENGGLTFVAPGNSGQRIAAPAYQYIVATSGTDQQDNKAGFSSYGQLIDMSAPAVGIWTTNAGGGYSAGSGTSFCSPIAAGCAAIVMSVKPRFTPLQVEQALEINCDDLGAPGWDEQFGWGRINMSRTLSWLGSFD